METGIYVSSPWNVKGRRKSDPLGFQNIANEIARTLVPGINQGHQDCRWLTLLCKGLLKIQNQSWTYEMFSNYERNIINFAIDKNETTGRHLPGKKAAKNYWPKRYRYYGPYGSYRSLLIELKLLENDGWSLTEEGKRLGGILPFSVDFRLRKTKYYKKFAIACLPLKGDDTLMSPKETDLIGGLLFGETENGKIRFENLKRIEKPKFFWNGREHFQLFDLFTRSCFKAFAEILEHLKENPRKKIPPPENWDEIIRLSGEVINNRAMWKDVKSLAKEIIKPDQAPEILLRHSLEINPHSNHWAEKINDKWFCMDNKGTPKNNYRYRLWNLWRLGYQVGRITTDYPFDQTDEEDEYHE
jgi:hypothetical protein